MIVLMHAVGAMLITCNALPGLAQSMPLVPSTSLISPKKKTISKSSTGMWLDGLDWRRDSPVLSSSVAVTSGESRANERRFQPLLRPVHSNTLPITLSSPSPSPSPD